jgi:vitamin B12 transporter
LVLGASTQAAGQTAVPNSPNAIVVTGTAVAVAREQIGNSNTVISGETVENQKQAYLADMLREVPGIAVNQAGSFGAQSQVFIRGGEANHTLVLVDGIDISDATNGEFDFSALLASNIDRVEVLRGPQSGLYGSNALAGVINVITKGGDGPRFDGAVEYGTYDSKFARAGVRLGSSDAFVTASGIYRETDGFSSAATGTEPDGDRNLTGYLRAGARLGSIGRIDGSLRYVDKHTETDGFDFSGGPLQGLAIDDDSYADTTAWSGGTALTLDPVAHWQSVLSASYNSSRMIGGYGATPAFGDHGSRLKLAARSTFDFTTPGFASAAHTLTGFVEYKRERFRNPYPTDPSQDAAQKRNLWGYGAEYRLGLFDSLFLSATVRHDDNDEFRDDTTFGVAGSWVIRRSGTRPHASYGTGVTNPTFYEQFGFIPGQFTGNPNLHPEKAVGWDFGIEQRLAGDRLMLDLTYFHSMLTDEIVSVFPTVVNDTGRSKREGVEATAQLRLGPVGINGSYTYLHATDPDGTREVRRPKGRASLEVAANFGPEHRGNISVGVIHNGRMLDNDFRDFFRNGFQVEKSPLSAYTLVRVSASYRVTDKVELFGRLENAFDETYQESISYATPGRAVYGGVRVTIP